MTLGIDNVKIGHALTFGMPKKVFSYSFTNIEWVSVPLLSLKVNPHAGLGKMKITVHLLRSPCLTCQISGYLFSNRRDLLIELLYFFAGCCCYSCHQIGQNETPSPTRSFAFRIQGMYELFATFLLVHDFQNLSQNSTWHYCR